MADNRDELIADLNARIEEHSKRGHFDSFWHNFLIIFALAAGVVSLVTGLLWQSGPWAAVIGVIPSACALLLSNLDCVRAKNWHAEFVVGLDGIKRSLKFETQNPSSDDIAKCSKALTELESKMAAAWAEGEKEKKLSFAIMKQEKLTGETA